MERFFALRRTAFNDETSFFRHFAELSDEDHVQLWVPEGFAHGFLTLSDTAVVQYKCRGAYVPGSEHTLIWNDPALAIEWPADPTQISAKDQAGKTLEALQAEVLLAR